MKKTKVINGKYLETLQGHSKEILRLCDELNLEDVDMYLIFGILKNFMSYQILETNDDDVIDRLDKVLNAFVDGKEKRS